MHLGLFVFSFYCRETKFHTGENVIKFRKPGPFSVKLSLVELQH